MKIVFLRFNHMNWYFIWHVFIEQKNILRTSVVKVISNFIAVTKLLFTSLFIWFSDNLHAFRRRSYSYNYCWRYFFQFYDIRGTMLRSFDLRLGDSNLLLTTNTFGSGHLLDRLLGNVIKIKIIIMNSK